MKKYLIVILLAQAFTSYGQNTIVDCSDLTDDSLQYDFVHKYKTVLKNGKTLIGNYLKIKMSESCKNYLKKKDWQFWLDKFNKVNSAWAANILLYYLNLREASSILVLDQDKSKWPSIKEEEISYWKNFFLKQRSN